MEESISYESFQSALWSDRNESEHFPEKRLLLAHYTSIEVLEKILLNDEIWFSHPLNMNDKEELLFGMQQGAFNFRNSEGLRAAFDSEEKYFSLIHFFNQLYDRFDRDHAINTYVLCLTEHEQDDIDGALSMWRGYGANGGGVSIVINTKKLSENNSSPFVIDKVHYATSDDRINFLKNKILKLAELLKTSALLEGDLFNAAWYWLEWLKMFSLYSKHKGFSEEREWRIVYMPDRDKDSKLKEMLSYATSKSGIQPKLKLKLQPVEGLFEENIRIENFADRIILGPTSSSLLVEEAVKRIVMKANKIELCEKIYSSSIPYRN